MRLIDADALTEFLKCLLPKRGMWEIEGDTAKDAICETVAEAIEMVKNMETIQPAKAQLSQEGTTKGTTSDTISRQAAIDAAKDWYEGLICGSINGLIKRFNALPTVQPEPKEGHWIDKGWNGDWAWQIDGRGNCWRVIECSECGKRVSTGSNYCPHCGAKMRGEQHETD